LVSKKEVVLLALIMVVGATLRFYKLAAKSIWVDEAIQVALAKQDIPTLFRDYLNQVSGTIAGNAYQHDITTALILHPLASLDDSEFWMRLIPALAGILSIALVFRLSQLLYDTRLGLLAAFVFAISPYSVWYSQTARPFGFSLLFSLISLVMFLLALNKRHARYWVLYTLFSALNIYVFYFGIFLIAFQGLYLLFCQRKDHRACRTWLFSQMAMFVFLLPGLGLFLSQLVRRTASSNVSMGPEMLVSLGAPWYAFAVGSLSPSVRNLLIALPAVVFGGLMVLCGFVRDGKSTKQKSFLGLYLLVPYLLSLPVLLGMGSKIPMARALIFISPAYYILVATGILSCRERNKAIVFLSLFTIFSAISLLAYYKTDIYSGIRRAADHIREHAQETDAVYYLGTHEQLPLKYYLGDAIPGYGTWQWESLKEGLVGVTIERVWVVDYQQRSTTELVTSSYLGGQVARGSASELMGQRLADLSLRRVEEINFQSQNPVKLILYAMDEKE
jgi:uncharacterized membrane protein